MLATAIKITVFVALSAAFFPVAKAQTRSLSPFTVANIRSGAEASNSVEAKKLATEEAEQKAFRALLLRLLDFRSQKKIPDLGVADVERLATDIDVRKEGVSGTSYVATFTVNFSERGVTALFAQYGVFPITDRAPELLIVPVYVVEGSANINEANPWSAALRSLDLSQALAPAKVAPIRGDLTAAIANSYTANAGPAVEAMKAQYHVQQVVLALAELATGGEAITLKLAGVDAVGVFSIQKKVRAGDDPLIDAAAKLAFETLQERWKLTRETEAMPSPGREADPSQPQTYTTAAGAMTPVELTAEYSSLKEWQAIRGKLQGLPGVQNWTLKSVNPRSAQIGFDFAGGPDRFTALAPSQGLSVETGAGGLVVKTR